MSSNSKRFTYVCRRPPYGTIYAQEALDLILTGAAFDQQVSVAFIDDGVYQLTRDQKPSILKMKHFTRAFAALGDFEIKQIFVENESLQQRALNAGDLLSIPNEDGENAVQIVDAEWLSKCMEKSDVILQF